MSIRESSFSLVIRENKKPIPTIVKMGRMVFEIKSSVPWGIWLPIKEYQITRISDGKGQISEFQKS